MSSLQPDLNAGNFIYRRGAVLFYSHINNNRTTRSAALTATFKHHVSGDRRAPEHD